MDLQCQLWRPHVIVEHPQHPLPRYKKYELCPQKDESLLQTQFQHS